MRGAFTGIDIGTSTVQVVVVRQEKSGNFRIAASGSAPSAGVRRGMVINPEAAAGSLRRALREVGRSFPSAIRSALVAVSGPHLSSSVVRGAIAVSRADGEVTDEDVRRAVGAAERLIPKSPNREVIHLIPRTFRVDGEGGIADPVGMVGMKLEVEAIVVDGSRPALANLIKCCEFAGIEIDDWTAAPLAAAEVLLAEKQRELGVILLDLGAGTSDFVIFEEGHILDVGSLPIGGNHITQDIALGCRTPVAVAEAVKVRYAQAVLDPKGPRREPIVLAEFSPQAQDTVTLRDLTNIVSARLTDIFELVTKALKRVGRSQLLPGGVVLTGGVIDIRGIMELARRELRLPVEVAKATAVEAFNDVVPSRLAVPVGLVLWQFKSGRLRGGSARRMNRVAQKVVEFFRAFIP